MGFVYGPLFSEFVCWVGVLSYPFPCVRSLCVFVFVSVYLGFVLKFFCRVGLFCLFSVFSDDYLRLIPQITGCDSV